MNHSPTPWKWSDPSNHDGELIDANGRTVLMACYDEDYEPLVRARVDADGDFIVRAVNAHDELVAALRACVQQFGDTRVGHGGAYIVNAKRALAKAEAP